MRVLIEIIEHGTRRDERGENECECVFPVVFEKVFIREHEEREEEDEDNGCRTKSDIGMDTETEDTSGEEKG